VHSAQPANIDMVAHFAMPRERRLVGHDHVVSNDAIMRNMAIGHEEAPVADAGRAAAVVGAAVHGHAFADAATLADHERRLATLVRKVLRRAAERCKWPYDRIRADGGSTLYADMAFELYPVTQHRPRFDMTERTD